MISKLDIILRKSYFILVMRPISLKFRHAAVAFAMKLPYAPKRSDTIAAKNFLVSLIDEKNYFNSFQNENSHLLINSSFTIYNG